MGYADAAKARIILAATVSVPFRGSFWRARGHRVLRKQLKDAVSLKKVVKVAHLIWDMRDDAEELDFLAGLAVAFLTAMIEVQHIMCEVVEVVCSEPRLSKILLHLHAQAIARSGVSTPLSSVLVFLARSRLNRAGTVGPRPAPKCSFRYGLSFVTGRATFLASVLVAACSSTTPSPTPRPKKHWH